MHRSKRLSQQEFTLLHEKQAASACNHTAPGPASQLPLTSGRRTENSLSTQRRCSSMVAAGSALGRLRHKLLDILLWRKKDDVAMFRQERDQELDVLEDRLSKPKKKKKVEA